jgi:ABC-2 type transport system permease protein
MMFGPLLAFELRGHFRRPVTWLYVVIMFALAFFALSTDVITVGSSLGKVKRNSPYNLAQMFGILLAIGQIISGAIVSSAILRDFDAGVHELVFTTRLTRAAYLGAKFLAAFLAMLLVFAAVPIGALAGTIMPWTDQEYVQAVQLWHYVHPWLVIGVPGVFFLSALLFAVGALTRNAFAGYVTGILLLVGYTVGDELIRTLDNDRLANAIDPFALRSLELTTRYWTPAERNTQVLPIGGFLGENRLLWVSIGAVMLAAAFRLVRLEKSAPAMKRRQRVARETPKSLAVGGGPVAPREVQAPGLLDAWWTVLHFHARSLLRSVPFLAIAAIGLINVFMSAWFADRGGASRTWPMSWFMAETVVGASGLFMIVLITFYAGELVWRERQVGLDQVLDASPVPTISVLLGKSTAMVVLLAAFAAVGTLTAMLVQVIKGFPVIDVRVYLLQVFVVNFPGWLTLVALAFLVQAVVPRKAVGHVVVILIYFGTAVLANYGWNYKLLMLGESPAFRWSDLNGAGPYPAAFLPVHGYWVSMAAIFIGLAYLAWQRGIERRPAEWRMRLAGRARIGFAGALAGAALFGGLFYSNASIRNRFETRSERELRSVDYEKQWRPYESLTLPTLTAVSLQVDLEPERRRARTAGDWLMVNRAARALDTVYLDLPQSETGVSVVTDSLAFDRPADLAASDSLYGVRLYVLREPLEPGDTLRLRFVQRWEPNGFGNGGFSTTIAENGTFLNRGEFPQLGYQPRGELDSEELRRKYQLPEVRRGKSRSDSAALRQQEFFANAEFIAFDATLSTAPDQIAIAPGYLEREWMEGGRRYFRYVMDAPIPDFYSVLSARWAVQRDSVDGIAIEVYHHPTHTFNVQHMLEASKASLRLFAEAFGPYQHRQLRILEFPRYANFAQSFPNTVPYSEGIGFVARVNQTDVEDTDFPYFVTAHEIAHQWFPYQRMSADVEGKDMLSESFSEYAALVVAERRHGRPFTQKFLRSELDQYLRGRAGERIAEHSLATTYQQAYIHYQKGALSLYALRDLLGEEALHGAIRSYQDERRFMGPPYGTTLDFLRQLSARTPDSLRYAIEDYLETITLWDVKADSVTSTSLPDGRWKVTVVATASKLRADSLGAETAVPMNDLVDVGVFDAARPGARIGEPIAIRKVRVATGTSRHEFIVDRKPVRAGVDPYNLLIDRNPGDNTRDVKGN